MSPRTTRQDMGIGPWSAVLAAAAVIMGAYAAMRALEPPRRAYFVDGDDAGIILADPLASAAPSGVPDGTATPGDQGTYRVIDASPSDYERMIHVRDSLKAAKRRGDLSDADRRMLRHVCRQLRDKSCSE